MPRTKKPTAPVAALVVSAVVTVMCTPDGGADIHVKVDCDGHEALVAAVTPHTPKLRIAGAALRRVVLGALSAETTGPTVDVLAQRKVAGRA